MKADQTNQLDLLDWRASASIHVFPPARRMGLVRVVADELSHDDESDLLWAAVVGRLTAELRQLGVLTENEIECRLLDFRDAVQAELNRGHLARNF